MLPAWPSSGAGSSTRTPGVRSRHASACSRRPARPPCPRPRFARSAPASRSSTRMGRSPSMCRARPGRHRRRARHRVPAAAADGRRPGARRDRASTCRCGAGSACRSRAGTRATPTSTTTRRRRARSTGCAPIRASRTCRSSSSAGSSGASSRTRRTSSRSGATPSRRPTTSSTSARRRATTRRRGPMGYGHLMLINLAAARRAAQPRPAGRRREPGLSAAHRRLREARGQGGLAIWCHNGDRDGGAGRRGPRARSTGSTSSTRTGWTPSTRSGTRCSTAACGCPASTGSDWFVCSSNRVYVDVGADFTYRPGWQGLRDGRTFITDGPILRLTVGRPRAVERGPRHRRRTRARSTSRWSGPAAVPITAIEVVARRDGRLAARRTPPGREPGRPDVDRRVPRAGLRRARGVGRATATTTRSGPTPARCTCATPPSVAIRRAPPGHSRHIDQSLEWITTRARFDDVASATGCWSSSARGGACTNASSSAGQAEIGGSSAKNARNRSMSSSERLT